MVTYRRKNGFKRTYRSKKRYASKAKSMSYLSRRINQVAKAARPELKFLDTGFSNQAVSATGSFFTMNNVAQGTTQSERIGREITNKYLSAKLNIILDPTATDPTANARLVLFIDRQPQASTPAWADIYTSNSPYSFLNLDNSKRFKILKSVLLNFEGNNAVSGQYTADSATKNITMNVKLRSKTDFDTSGGITSNHIYFAYIADVASTLTIVNATFRFRYTDA